MAAPGYDFGGAECPLDGYEECELIVVDTMPTDRFKEQRWYGAHGVYNYHNPYVEADITKPLDLAPLPFINVSKVLRYVKEDLDKVAANIDRCLEEGGDLRVFDEEVLVRRLSDLLNYEVTEWELVNNNSDFDEPDEYLLRARKPTS